MTHTAVAWDAKSGVGSDDPRLKKMLADGERLFADGDIAGAEKCFHQILTHAPEQTDALNNLGVLAHSRGQREAAIALFTRSLLADPGNQEAAQNLLPILELIPVAELVSVGRYALPYILIRYGSDSWGDLDNQFLQRAVSSLDPEHQRTVLNLVLQKKSTAFLTPLVTLLGAISELTSPQIEALDSWLRLPDLHRRQRDQIEFLICTKGRDDQLVQRVAHRDGFYRDGFFAPGWERYPRRIVSPAQSDDPFMKEVPAGAPSKKGGMRVLIVSDFNIAGQCTALMRALNKYTNHMARCVIVQDDYLSYDRDVLLKTQDGQTHPDAVAEACQLIKAADFYHFGRGLFTFPEIDWNKYLSPQNCVFQYYGSEIRDNGPQVAAFHATTQFPAITAVDLTMYRLLPASYYHIQPYMLEMDQLPQTNWDAIDTLKLCHAPSSANYRKIKRTDLILDVMNRLVNEKKNVESVLIENMSNAQCLEAKSRCHIHIVSLLTVFGLNAIESAAMGLVPICGVDNFSRLIYPESPIPNASAENLYDVVRDLIENPNKTRELGLACREWVRPLFDARNLVQKYWYLYDVIYNGLSVDYPELFRN